MDHSLIKPIIIPTSSSGWQHQLNMLKSDHPEIVVVDYYQNQLNELFLIRNPKDANNQSKRFRFIDTFLHSKSPENHGNWIYYPWRNTLVHLLEESAYQEIRTARNRPIISKRQQDRFLNLTIGVVGLSVGNAIAQNIVYSGGCNTVKLADADILELSNLNRVQASTVNLGSNKAITSAQQIYEINPYAQVIIYDHKIDVNNIMDFLTSKPKVDLVVDECDDLTLKNYLRLIARASKIPLLSITDVGLESKVDFHRFDLTSKTGGMRKVPDFSVEELLETYRLTEPVKLSPREQLKLIVDIVGKKNVSQEMQNGSMLRANLKLAGWPQLAMTVFAGASLATYITLLYANNVTTYAQQKSVSFPSLLKPGYLSQKAIDQRRRFSRKFSLYLRKR